MGTGGEDCHFLRLWPEGSTAEAHTGECPSHRERSRRLGASSRALCPSRKSKEPENRRNTQNEGRMIDTDQNYFDQKRKKKLQHLNWKNGCYDSQDSLLGRLRFASAGGAQAH